MDSNLTNIVADELVNEILESALDIATKVSDSALKWRSFTDISEADNVCIDTNETCNKSANFNEIIEGLTKMNAEKAKAEKETSETAPLAIEVKKLLNEMMSPPYEIVNYDKAPIKGGVGDQPPKGTDKEQEPIPETPQVEKKSRVTDLIKNSKQILSEYIMKEKAKPMQDKLEETQEEIIQVIELDCVKPGDEPFKAHRKYIPEEVPLPDDDEEIEEIIRVQPDDHTMEAVNLSEQNVEDQNACTSKDALGGKGDEFNHYNMIVVLSPNENSHLNEGESPSSVNVVTDESSDVLKDAVKQTKEKKRWNFGSRLIGFFKKQPKAQQGGMKK